MCKHNLSLQSKDKIKHKNVNRGYIKKIISLLITKSLTAALIHIQPHHLLCSVSGFKPHSSFCSDQTAFAFIHIITYKINYGLKKPYVTSKTTLQTQDVPSLPRVSTVACHRKHYRCGAEVKLSGAVLAGTPKELYKVLDLILKAK